ncbi:triose-phosphate isomerase [Candidatus Nomurabacteria bacterium]|nr:triose-phosphate isomerase [Candidatus Nomurabacteria bacterium]
MQAGKNKIIIANWKMNPLTSKEAEKLFQHIIKSVSLVKRTAIVICPPSLYLAKLRKFSRKILLGAQDAFWGEGGPFTGEISGEMVYNIGGRYVILGHSERRAGGETNGEVNKKIKASLTAGLRPILCVGETMRDANHSYFNSVKNQLAECLDGVKKDLIHKVVIAYEPVWAISSTPNRHDATPADSLEMTIFIRKIISDKFGAEASKIRIVYGGSVSEKDAGDFFKNGGVDGLLAGKASLDAKKFIEIIKICEASSR